MFNTKITENTPRINLLNEELTSPQGKKTFKISKFILYLFIILIIFFLVFTYQVLLTNNSLSGVFGGKINIFNQLTAWTADGGKLKGEGDDRINILLLGIGGEGHDGPYLTDTIMLLSLKPSTKKISMLSIPRDLLVDIPGYGSWKINSANSFGEKNNPHNGGLLSKEVVANILDIPIQYYVRIDFSGFEKIIDDVDGVKIYVDQTFDDYQYPIYGKENAPYNQRYSHLHFDKGWQTMDSSTALKYVRSRHGNNGEGSDYARSRRQQKVLQALKEKFSSTDFWLNPTKINKVSKELASNLKTDFEPWEILKLAQSINGFDTTNIITRVLDDGPNGYLYASFVNEAFVLQPRGNDYTAIREMIKNIFNSPVAQIEKTIPRVEIRNGTKISGLASREADALKLKNYLVSGLANAPEQNYKKTIIYKLSDKELKPEQLFLEQNYKTKIQTTIPDWIKDSAAPNLDFFIILGEDADVTKQ
jgi:LCP family protein required for cell wall assembly